MPERPGPQSLSEPSRRGVVAGAVVSAVALCTTTTPAAARPLRDTPVPAGATDAFRTGRPHTADVLAPWGSPLESGVPDWDGTASAGAEQQARQIGTHHSGLQYRPLTPAGRRAERGLLVIGHEYPDETLLLADGGRTSTTPSGHAKALAAVGVTVVEVRRTGDGWRTVLSRRNRRVTGATPVVFSGPVTAGHPRLRTPHPPRGVLAAGFGGTTPWGTQLVCEENFHRFFGTDHPGWTPDEAQRRYGLNAFGYGHQWHRADERFDLAAHPGEANRYGWVVEIDPMDPAAPPVKRTALGRFGHTGATVTESRGRAVVYSGDDEDGGYLYKFVGAAAWRSLLGRGHSPLDHGTLYVARFEDDGFGRWLPLVHGNGPLTARNGWRDQADVLLRARQAADALRATPLDRPQQTAVHPRTAHRYIALANGTGAGAVEAGCAPDPPGPRPASPWAGNRCGHILRWQETGDDARSGTFGWGFFAWGGYTPHRVAGSSSAAFGSPKGLCFDRGGRLWITTGHTGEDRTVLGNNALLLADPATGEVTRVATGPHGAELTGVAGTPDGRTVFVNVQHPGERTPGWGAPTPGDPRAVGNWPDHDPSGRPRSATVALRRLDGGRVTTP
ncbi:PhoX family protein [Streptomyces sp. NPDC059781]|uniref:PhoX family protein n=1 Tax=unclassified Streptomyces TaxID=2593676 RepID=UPI00365C43F5